MADERPGEPAGRRVNPLLRFLAGVFGLSLVGLGQASAAAGGVFGIGLALILDLVGVAIILIAIGVVEWWVRRHPGPSGR